MHDRYDRAESGRQSRHIFCTRARNCKLRRVPKTAGQTGRRVMSERTTITRRSVLRGMGTAIALPWLESMLPSLVQAAPQADASGSNAGRPLRLAFLYVPNGVHMEDWTPNEEGENFALPSTLEPLAAFKNDLCVLTGLTQQKAFANGDG